MTKRLLGAEDKAEDITTSRASTPDLPPRRSVLEPNQSVSEGVILDEDVFFFMKGR